MRLFSGLGIVTKALASEPRAELIFFADAVSTLIGYTLLSLQLTLGVG